MLEGPGTILGFEDFQAGQVYDLGETRLEADDIIAFARQVDPQPFHMDPAFAETSVHGGLIASGWHTLAVWMRAATEHLFGRSAISGCPAVDKLRWPQPARPGDRLSATFEVVGSTPSPLRPGTGLVRGRAVLRNQHGQVVMTFLATIVIGGTE